MTVYYVANKYIVDFLQSFKTALFVFYCNFKIYTIQFRFSSFVNFLPSPRVQFQYFLEVPECWISAYCNFVRDAGRYTVPMHTVMFLEVPEYILSCTVTRKYWIYKWRVLTLYSGLSKKMMTENWQKLKICTAYSMANFRTLQKCYRMLE